jgi:hypothetical protein
VKLLVAGDVDAIGARAAKAQRDEKIKYQRRIPLLEDGSTDALVEALCTGWKLDVKPKPKLEDFLPTPQGRTGKSEARKAFIAARRPRPPRRPTPATTIRRRTGPLPRRRLPRAGSAAAPRTTAAAASGNGCGLQLGP